MAGKKKELDKVKPGTYSNAQYAKLAGITPKSVLNRINAGELPSGVTAELVVGNYVITVV